MSKNLEKLKEIKKDYIRGYLKYCNIPGCGMVEEDAINIGFFMDQTLKVLEDQEERLKKVEAKLGIYTEKEIKNIKVGLTDPN